uniref:Uncharacterized protein n=1 Tax=Ditylenchus dipsaci TaxID=166011 RepID=A0A915CWR9_9BILA
MSLDSVNSMNQPSSGGITGVFPRRALTIGEAPVLDDLHIYTLTVYLHAFNPETDDSTMSRKRSIVGESTVDILCKRHTTTEELIEKILDQKADVLKRNTDDFEIFETMGTVDGRTFKERKLDRGEYPVTVQTLWPRSTPADSTTEAANDDLSVPRNRFVCRRKDSRASAGQAVLQQPQKNYADLCNLPELTEQTLLDNLKDRFNSGHIYTYIGPILVAVNPFNFFPIYNPKYSRLYCQSRRLEHYHLTSMLLLT